MRKGSIQAMILQELHGFVVRDGRIRCGGMEGMGKDERRDATKRAGKGDGHKGSFLLWKGRFIGSGTSVG